MYIIVRSYFEYEPLLKHLLLRLEIHKQIKRNTARGF